MVWFIFIYFFILEVVFWCKWWYIFFVIVLGNLVFFNFLILVVVIFLSDLNFFKRFFLCFGFKFLMLFNLEVKLFLLCNWWWNVMVKWWILFWICCNKKNFCEFFFNGIIFKFGLNKSLFVLCLLFLVNLVIGILIFSWLVNIFLVILIWFLLLLIKIKLGKGKFFFKICEYLW